MGWGVEHGETYGLMIHRLRKECMDPVKPALCVDKSLSVIHLYTAEYKVGGLTLVFLGLFEGDIL